MKVKNRSAHRVGYTIPNLAERLFNPGQEIEISEEEIRQLSYQPGGQYILDNYLQLCKNDRNTLNFDKVEMEYDYSEEDVKRIILKGSLDEFRDMLDFAPEGVITLVKSLAFSLPLADLNKADAFKEKFGYDLATAIKHQQEVEKALKGEGTPEETVTRQRRVQPSKYNIVE